MMEDAVGQIAVAALRRFLPPVGVVNRYATGGAIMAILVVTAYIAGVVAAWFALSDVYGPAIASLVVALSCLVLALVTWGVTTLLNRMARERRAREARLRAGRCPIRRSRACRYRPEGLARPCEGEADHDALVCGRRSLHGDPEQVRP